MPGVIRGNLEIGSCKSILAAEWAADYALKTGYRGYATGKSTRNPRTFQFYDGILVLNCEDGNTLTLPANMAGWEIKCGDAISIDSTSTCTEVLVTW